jgi:hypothetical protein
MKSTGAGGIANQKGRHGHDTAHLGALRRRLYRNGGLDKFNSLAIALWD